MGYSTWGISFGLRIIRKVMVRIMNAVICACNTMKDELSYVMKENSIDIPVIYGQSGLHSKPENLKKFVQKTVDRFDDVDYILLGYGLCGTGLAGISSKKSTLIFPQYHDCIAIMLGSNERYKANLSEEMGALFYTKGWMRYLKPIEAFYEDIIPRLGEKKAARCSELILKSYKRIAMIETGAYDSEALFKEIEKQAEFFNLETCRMEGTVDVLRKLVQGKWDENFQIVPPGKEIEIWI